MRWPTRALVTVKLTFANRREDRVEPNRADRLFVLGALAGDVAAAALDDQFHLEFGALVERRDMLVGRENFEARTAGDVARGHLPSPWP